ncbi:MAG: hypothetical protein ACFCGT_15115, partial [Sandaracinaceae bacterium]
MVETALDVLEDAPPHVLEKRTPTPSGLLGGVNAGRALGHEALPTNFHAGRCRPASVAPRLGNWRRVAASSPPGRPPDSPLVDGSCVTPLDPISRT